MNFGNHFQFGGALKTMFDYVIRSQVFITDLYIDPSVSFRYF